MAGQAVCLAMHGIAELDLGVDTRKRSSGSDLTTCLSSDFCFSSRYVEKGLMLHPCLLTGFHITFAFSNTCALVL